MSNSVALFQDKAIRKIFHEGQWWFSVIDVIGALMNNGRSRKYWSDLKVKLADEGYDEVSDNIGQLKLTASDGKLRLTDVANTETLLRIVQSISSPKAEPFKRWLAKVGYERVQEIDNPELASNRARETYRAKGYSDSWIEKRMRGIQVREELTSEWRQRGVQEGKEYSILTAEISKATFGITPAQYKERKGLKHENLRDHMTDLELIFSMLGEASTTEIARKKDAQGLPANRKAAKDGGSVAGNARRELELKSGGQVVGDDNYLTTRQSESASKLPQIRKNPDNKLA